MLLRSCSVGARFVSTPDFTNSGSSSAVEFSSVMPSSARTLATAPSRESVLRVVSESSSVASFQSGRMLEKICLCFTCPAMTARVTPSRRKVSMSLESSPSESQCTVAPRDSISGEVSSLIAATTTSKPCARAASSTRNGKHPLPAMMPSLGSPVNERNPNLSIATPHSDESAYRLGSPSVPSPWLYPAMHHGSACRPNARMLNSDSLPIRSSRLFRFPSRRTMRYKTDIVLSPPCSFSDGGKRTPSPGTTTHLSASYETHPLKRVSRLPVVRVRCRRMQAQRPLWVHQVFRYM